MERETVCPLCNGLETIADLCPVCGGLLQDGGPIENYLGPYSPYMEKDSFQQEDRAEEYCEHLLYCLVCGNDIRVVRWLTII